LLERDNKQLLIKNENGETYNRQGGVGKLENNQNK